MKRILIAAAAAGLAVSAAQAQYAPPPGGWDAQRFWHEAPTSPRERIDYLENRVDRDYAAGRLDGREARKAKAELGHLRNQIRAMHEMDGRLTPRDADFIQIRLDQISRQIHWQDRH